MIGKCCSARHFLNVLFLILSALELPVQQQATATRTTAYMPAADAWWRSSSAEPDKALQTAKPDTNRSDPDVDPVLKTKKRMWYKCN